MPRGRLVASLFADLGDGCGGCGGGAAVRFTTRFGELLVHTLLHSGAAAAARVNTSPFAVMSFLSCFSSSADTSQIVCFQDAAACLRLLHNPQLAVDTARRLVDIFTSGRFAAERAQTVEKYRTAAAAGTASRGLHCQFAVSLFHFDSRSHRHSGEGVPQMCHSTTPRGTGTAKPPPPLVPAGLSPVDVGAAKALTSLAVSCAADLLCEHGLSAAPNGLWTLLAATKAALRLARGGGAAWLQDPVCCQIDRVGASWFGGASAFELVRDSTVARTGGGDSGEAPPTALLVVVFSSLGNGLVRPEFGRTLEGLGIRHDRLHVLDAVSLAIAGLLNPLTSSPPPS